MDFTILLTIFAFIGIVCGIFLTYSNKSEIKDAKKYLILSQKILISLSIFLTAYFLQPCCGSILVAILIIVFLFIARKRLPTHIFYPVLGILVYLTTKVPEAFLANIALIFMYGIPTGTLLMYEKKYDRKKVMIGVAKNLGYFICIVLILFPVF
ncbi:MAG: hypothetical protein KAT43_05320 [Nanoarchaeota archaeon]|nr:hypothetical protein [Nanoarchaeota archaeon]